MAPSILVIGSANIDLVTRVPRMPTPGQTIIGSSFTTVTGGKGANQAVAAARLGGRVRFAACLGEDVFGEQQRHSLAEAGVDLGLLKIDPHAPTGTAVILVADTGENIIVVTPGANYSLRAEDLAALEPDIAAADVVLLQLELRLETVEAALDLARKTNTFSLLDTGAAQAVPPEMLAKAQLVSPNESEATALTGIAVHDLDSARRAAQQLRDWGVAHVVMKLGARGALYLGPNQEIHSPAFKVDPVDTVAAGDAFTAAIALTWHSHAPAEALRYANAAGALATLTPGAQSAMPTRAATEAFLQNAAS